MDRSGQPADPWALDAAGLAAVLAAIGDGRTRVIECGSGASTVAIAGALQGRRGARVQALEHLPRFAARTRAALAQAGLDEIAEVIEAPLVAPADGDASPWYAQAAVDQLDGAADLLLVDGPPGDGGPAARAPALGRLAGKLSAGCLVMLDDADRPGEEAAIREWEREHDVVFERVAPRLVAGTLG